MGGTEIVALSIQAVAATAAAFAAWQARRSSQASGLAAKANQDAVREMRKDREFELRQRQIEDLRRLHEILTDMDAGDFHNPNTGVYPLKRELKHLLEVCGMTLSTCRKIAGARQDPAEFRGLIPAALEEVRVMIRELQLPGGQPGEG